jgi:rhodanese-related sulfurtransferase
MIRRTIPAILSIAAIGFAVGAVGDADDAADHYKIVAHYRGEDRGDLAVLSELRKAGSELSLPTTIVFYVYVPTHHDAEAAAQTLCDDGFDSVVADPLGKLDDGSRSDDWGVIGLVTAVPAISFFRHTRPIFDALAARYKGSFDGWEAAIQSRATEGLPDSEAEALRSRLFCRRSPARAMPS